SGPLSSCSTVGCKLSAPASMWRPLLSAFQRQPCRNDSLARPAPDLELPVLIEMQHTYTGGYCVLWRPCRPPRLSRLWTHEGEWQGQASTRAGRHPVTPPHDQTADLALPQPLRTPGAQELCGPGKCLRQGDQGTTDIGDGRLDVHLPIDPQRGRGGDLTVGA